MSVENGTCQRTPLMDKAVKELKEYLQGERKYFDVPLKLEGSEYQKKVWNIIRSIPYGKTIYIFSTVPINWYCANFKKRIFLQ